MAAIAWRVQRLLSRDCARGREDRSRSKAFSVVRDVGGPRAAARRARRGGRDVGEGKEVTSVSGPASSEASARSMGPISDA